MAWDKRGHSLLEGRGLQEVCWYRAGRKGIPEPLQAPLPVCGWDPATARLSQPYS